MPATLTVNGSERELGLGDEERLLTALRDELHLTGAKAACGEGACGACTVLLDGKPVRACVTPLFEAVGKSITTVEGLAPPGALHAVQRAFLEAGAMQCGFCTSGMILETVSLLKGSASPDDAQIRAQLDGNLCRCCTYPRILRAVHRAAELLREGGAQGAPPAPPSEPVRAPLPDLAQIPNAPWDLRPPEAWDSFRLLGDGLVVVLSPEAANAWNQSRPPPNLPLGGAWLHVGANGVVTAFTGKVDVGQDARTGLSLLVAEELRVPLASVRLVMGDTDCCPYDMGTFGSRGMPDAGEQLRFVAATAREALLELAGSRQPMPRVEELVRGLRRIVHAGTQVDKTPGTAWKSAGQATPKLTGGEIVTGAHRYPSDLNLPGMLFGRVLRPPRFGAVLTKVDVSAAQRLPGVVAVHEGSFIGVAASSATAAREALAAVQAEWKEVPQPSESQLVAHLRTHPAERMGFEGVLRLNVGSPAEALASAPVRLEATYTTAYIAHAPLETRAVLASWEGGRLTLQMGTQLPFGVREEVAEELGLPQERIRVIAPNAGGGFGGKHAGEVACEAARLARAAGRPVKVVWTREEEFTWGHFRPAAVIDVRSGAQADGTLTAWEFQNWNSGSAGIRPPYAIPHQHLFFQPAHSPLSQGPYRALAATANHFARESHLDELAHRLGRDPLALRLQNLRDERLAAVFRAAAGKAGWDSWRATPGRGLGIAGGMEKNGRVATCAQVEVDAAGHLRIERIVAAYECGAMVNPDNVLNQVEGAIVMGLGGALFEAIHFDDGRILNPHFSEYRVPRFSDVPPIEVVLLDKRDVPPAGAGETPMVGVAPALANAIFQATGKRLRSMPLAPDGRVT